MDEQLKDLDFEEWLIYVFDHPVTETNSDDDFDFNEWLAHHTLGDPVDLPQGYFQEERDWWDESANPSVTVEYMTRLFENASALLQPYSDEQINQGLWFIISADRSNHIFALYDVKKDVQRKFWDSIYHLYADFFAVKCSPHLSYLNEKGANPINWICNMWWDIIPIQIKTHTSENKRTYLGWDSLALMKRCLEIKHDACLEGTLHGLGHWKHAFPDEVKQIVGDFLKANPKLRPELRQYAEWAQYGSVQ